MGFTFKNEAELAKAGIIIDPGDPTVAVPVARLNDLHPNSSWSDDRLVQYGTTALNTADKYTKEATILT